MDYEFTITVANKPYNVFLQPGFSKFNMYSKNLHKHSYPEIHLFHGGDVEIFVDACTHKISDSEFCVIPPKNYHCFLAYNKSILHTAFQVDAPLKTFQRVSLPKQITGAYIDAIRENNYTKISSYISLICAHFFPDTLPAPHERTDYNFIISEFLSTHYNDPVTLRDLAELLHLSEKQTTRLVLKQTGQSFADALTTHRMNTADFLRETTSMSLTDIAAYVGYKSYSGFWKAYQKHKNK